MLKFTTSFSAFAIMSLLLGLTFGIAGGARAQAVFMDTFAGTAGTTLASHTADTTNGTGASWTTSAPNYLLDGSGGLYDSATSDTLAMCNAAPTSTSYSVQADYVFKTTPTGYIGIGLHYTSDSLGGLGFTLLYHNGNLEIWQGANPLVSVPYPVTAPTTIPKVALVCSVSGGTATLTGYVNGTAVPGLTGTSTSSLATTIGSGGLWANENAGATTLIHLTNFSVGTNLFTAGPPATLSIGAATVTPGNTSAIVTFPAATGGTAPYTYQISRSAISQVATGTPVGTGLTLSDSGLSPATSYYYRDTVTDSTSPTPVTAVSPQAPVVTLPNVVNIGFIGTSITYGVGAGTTVNDPPDQACLTLSSVQGDQANASYHAINYGQSGTTTGNWLPTDTATETTSGQISTNLFSRALAAFAAASVHIIHIEDMAVNDSKIGYGVTLAQHGASLQSIINGCLTSGYVVALDPPTYVVPGSYGTWNEASDVFLSGCQSQDAGFAVPGKVFVGSGAYALVANTPALLFDGVHPTPTGGQALGKTWARPIVAAQTYVPAVAASILTQTRQPSRGR